MIRIRIVSTAAVVAALLAIPAGAGAAPPAMGNAQPERAAPQMISRAYVGPAIVGPRSWCGPASALPGAPEPKPGENVHLCADVLLRSCRVWQRHGARRWKPAGAMRNISDEVLWVAPYARGYHWVFNLRRGFKVMATGCLTQFEPHYT